jgi:hypothetical protein
VLKPRLTALSLAATAALLLLPAAGEAAVTFGSRLVNDPSFVGCGGAACTLVDAVHPTFPNGDPSSDGAPLDGVITVFRIRAQADAKTQVTFRLANIAVQQHPAPDPPTALATAAGTGPITTIEAGPDPQTYTVPGRLPVKKGQHLAVDGSTESSIYATNGDPDTFVFGGAGAAGGPLVDGEGQRGSSGVTEELLVQADIEPDADHDGFGDETQDSCPSQAAVHSGPCLSPQPQPQPLPPRDTTPPAVRGLRVAGGAIAYALSEPATVVVRIDRAASGRRVHGACVRPTARNRRSPRCTRFVALLRSVRAPGAAGTDRLALPKVHGRKLGRGVYRLTLTARDAAGNATTIARQFRVPR